MTLIKQLLYNKRFIVGLTLFIIPLLLGILGPIIYPKDPLEGGTCIECPPSIEHPLGTDTFGRDILAQLMHGILSSLYVGFLAAILTMVIAVVVGSISGIKGGSMLDEVLMALSLIHI